LLDFKCPTVKKIKQDVVVNTSNISYFGGGGRRIMNLRPTCVKLRSCYLESKIQNKRDRDMTQVVELLASILEVLGLIFNSEKYFNICIYIELYYR
jgi:hypothetical protein